MIRAVTLGLPLLDHSADELSAQSVTFAETAARIAAASGLQVRTTRLTLPPLGPAHEDRAAVLSLLRTASNLAERSRMRWLCLPLDFTSPAPCSERSAAVQAAIRMFPRMFVNCMVASEHAIAASSVAVVARLISNIAKQSNNGFDNFRVGASCGCPANAPFFPFSHHDGPVPAFSLALETTRLTLDAIAGAPKGTELLELRQRVLARLIPALQASETFGRALERESGIVYRGLDASFAPFPDGSASVARLFQALTGCLIGAAGSLFLTSVLTDTLRAALSASGATPIGFNGVMFSVLEDDQLAAANSRRALSLEALMAFSSACGCGLDMVPIPGSTFPEEIEAVILDIAALAVRLRKPLGVRLLPIPGKSVNELTAFNLDFLCDSRVMELKHTDRSPLSSGQWHYLAAHKVDEY